MGTEPDPETGGKPAPNPESIFLTLLIFGLGDNYLKFMLETCFLKERVEFVSSCNFPVFV